MNHGDAAHQLGEAFLQLFAVVIGSGFFDLGADLLHAGLDFVGLAGAVNDGGVFLVDDHALGGAERGQGQAFQLHAAFFEHRFTAGEDGDVFEHGLTAFAEAGSLHGHHVQGAAELVHHEGGQGFAFDVFSDDHQRTVDLGDLFQHGEHVLHAGDLLFVAEDVGVVQFADHLFGVGHEVGGQVAAVELHAFDDIQRGFKALGFFNGDDAFLADLGHRFGDDVADGGVGVGGNGADLGDFFLIAGGLGDVAEFFGNGFNGLVDAALDGHGVAAGGHELHAFAVDGLSEHGGGGGAVAGDVVGLGGHFAHHLGAHVFKLVFELDFLGDGNAVLGDDGGAEGLFDHDVAALGSKGHLDGVGELIHAAGQFFTSFGVKQNFFGSHENILQNYLNKNDVLGRKRQKGRLGNDGKDVVFTHDEMLGAVDLDFGAGILVEEDHVAHLHSHGNELAVVGVLAGAHGDHFTLGGLFLGGVGDVQAAGGTFLGFEALHKNTVIQRFQTHDDLSSKKGIFLLQPAPSSPDCLRGIPASSPKWRTCPRCSGRGRSFQIGENARRGGKPCKRAVVFRPLVALNNPPARIGKGGTTIFFTFFPFF